MPCGCSGTPERLEARLETTRAEAGVHENAGALGLDEQRVAARAALPRTHARIPNASYEMRSGASVHGILQWVL